MTETRRRDNRRCGSSYDPRVEFDTQWILFWHGGSRAVSISEFEADRDHRSPDPPYGEPSLNPDPLNYLLSSAASTVGQQLKTSARLDQEGFAGLALGQLQSLIRVIVAGNESALAYGPGLRSGSGRVTLTADRQVQMAVRSLASRQPIAVVSTSQGKEVLQEVRHLLGLDPAVEIEALQTPNNVLVAFGRQRGDSVVVHLATNRTGRLHLRRQDTALRFLHRRGEGLEIRNLVAQVLDLQTISEVTRLTQSRLPGKVVDPAELDEGALGELIALALRPLVALLASGEGTSAGPGRTFIQEKFPRLKAIYPEVEHRLAPAIDALQRWPGWSDAPTALVHGDYWIGNLLFASRPTRLTGIIDWDRSILDGPPIVDSLHLIVASTSRWRQCSFGDVLPGIWDPNRRDPWLEGCLVRVRELFPDLEPLIGPAALFLWLYYLWNAYVEGLPSAENWLDRMTAEPAEAVSVWLAAQTGL